MSSVLVTTVTVVYNGEDHLDAALISLREQTYENLEIIVINDGSTDATQDIIDAHAAEDQRLKPVNNGQNLGLVKTRNKGLELASGKYIAILDADDISYSDRIEAQVAFMERHPGTAVCGARYVKVFEDGTRGEWNFPKSDEEIRRRMFWGVGHLNSSVMLRTETIREHHVSYHEEFPVSEDFKLFFDLGKYGELANLDMVLGEYRYHNAQQTSVKRELMERCSAQIMIEHFTRLSIDLNDKDKDLLYRFYSYKFPFDLNELKRLEELCKQFLAMNREKQLIASPGIKQDIVQRFFECCYFSPSLNAWKFARNSSLLIGEIRSLDWLKFFIRAIR